MVPTKVLIMLLLSLIRPLETLVMVTNSFKTSDWSTWFVYKVLTSCLMESMSSWFAEPNRKLNKPPRGRRDLFVSIMNMAN